MGDSLDDYYLNEPLDDDEADMDEIEKEFREWYEETCGIDRDDYDMDEVSGTFDVWKAATRRERERWERWASEVEPLLKTWTAGRGLPLLEKLAAIREEGRDE